MRRGATGTALTLLVAALVVAVGGCGSGKSTPPFVGPTLKNPSTAPSFALRDQHGRVVSIDGQRGKVALITFLYTHCPDVCPLTAMNLNTALGLIGAKRTDVVVLAVSVDPRGDTRAAVASFVRSHHLRPQFHYLTGSAQALQRVWRAYNVTAVRQGAGGDKGVDHTLYTMLVDPTGEARVLFDSLATPKSIAHDVGLLLPA